MEEELWVPVTGYEQLYEVSSLGRIRSKDRPPHKLRGNLWGKILSPKKTWSGYLTVCLSDHPKPRRMFLVHRLVAIAFLPNKHQRKCINHKNFNRADNRLCNLEWASHLENSAHAKTSSWHSRAVSLRSGENARDAVLTWEKVDQLRKMYATGKFSGNELGRIFGVSPRVAHRVLKKQSWKDEHRPKP